MLSAILYIEMNSRYLNASYNILLTVIYYLPIKEKVISVLKKKFKSFENLKHYLERKVLKVSYNRLCQSVSK